MIVEFILPELGENVMSGDVVTVHVAVGDTVKIDQPVLEIETDKAVIEVPSSVNGVVTELLVRAGDNVSPGQLIFKADEKEPGSMAKSEAAAESVAEPSSPKPAPSVQPAAPAAKPPQSATPVAIAPQRVAGAPKPRLLPSHVAAAPSVRRIAREIGVDITQVPGSGPGGRVTMQDVKNYSRRRHEEMQQARAQANVAIASQATQRAGIAEKKPLPDFSKWGEIERQPMSNVRRTTAEHLNYAWHAPHVTQFDKADITGLEKMRKKYARRVEEAGGKLTITAILLKFVAAALKVFPHFNASIDMSKHEIIFKKYYHIGVAVDTPRGLLVPVIRDVDQKSIIELAVSLTQLSERARNRKTSPEELQGGTFSITNLGGIGGTKFTPILNAPEVAILGVSRSRVEPVFNKDTGQFEPRLMLPLALSYDHRIIDGANGARFIRWLVEALENPFLPLLEG